MPTKLKTNHDTSFLKLIAIVSMLIDHIGFVFFPRVALFRQIGRLAFPIFCYCLTVGFLYTHDLRKYLTRLAVFAVISAPFHTAGLYDGELITLVTKPNIFFTLILSLIALWGFHTKKYWLTVLLIVVTAVLPFDYNSLGIVYVLIFYIFRDKPLVGAAVYVITCLHVFFMGVWRIELFTILAAPLIFIPMKTGIRINKWFFYAFYPAHLAVIALFRLIF